MTTDPQPEAQLSGVRHNHDLGEACRACLVNTAAVESAAHRQGEETLATARRVGSMYQNRAKDLAAVLLDARGLVRGVDADLDRRIDTALHQAGFLHGTEVSR